MVVVARETGWSYRDIMWEIPLSVVTQVCDFILFDKGAELRWMNGGVDIDELLNG